MKTILFFCALFLLPFKSVAVSKTHILAIGEQFSLKVQESSRFSVGNADIIQVRQSRLANGQHILLVRAKRQGFSDLLVLQDESEKNYRFRVYSKKKHAQIRDAQHSLAKAKGIEILPQKDSFIIRGKAKSLADHNLLEAFAQNNKKVQKLTTLDPKLRQKAVEKIRASLLQADLMEVSVRAVGSQIWLEGNVLERSRKLLAEKLAREVFFNVTSYLQIPFEAAPVLSFKLRILEMMRTNKRNLGLSWSNSVPGILQLHQSLLKAAVSLEASLNILSQKGLVNVLSAPELVLNAKGEAELFVGGEIPLRVSTKKNSRIDWKSYGLRLKLAVPGATQNLYRTKLSVSVSDLDLGNSQDDVPALKMSKMQTVVDLSRDKTVFLSGLIQSKNASSTRALPLLSRIPILGALFRSKNFQESRSELIIAITAKQHNSGENQHVKN